jgi:hypothetical protein
MRFLVTIRNRPATAGVTAAATYAATAAQSLRLASAEALAPWTAEGQNNSWAERSSRSKEWYREHQQAGRIEAAYVFPEGGGFMVVNVDSLEDLQDLIFSNPGSIFLEHEVHPLLEFDVGMDKLASSFAAGQAAAFAMISDIQ